MKLIELNPGLLVPNQRNLRRKPISAENFERLKASIAHVGILNPLHVTELTDGRHEVRHGDNRRLASLELELSVVPCLVPEAEEEAARLDQAQHIFEMLAENQDREGLTVSEEADGYAQLTLLDWSAEDIAQFRGVPVPKVKQALVLRSLPAAAHEKADAGLITLDDVLLLAEFDDDPETLQAILSHNTRSTSSLKHAIEDERRKRDHRRKTEQLRSDLDAAGVAVIDKPADYVAEDQLLSISRRGPWVANGPTAGKGGSRLQSKLTPVRGPIGPLPFSRLLTLQHDLDLLAYLHTPQAFRLNVAHALGLNPET